MVTIQETFIPGINVSPCSMSFFATLTFARDFSSFDLQSESLSKVFDFVMNRDVEGAVDFGNQTLDMVRRGDPSINIESLVISRTVKQFDQYMACENVKRYLEGHPENRVRINEYR